MLFRYNLNPTEISISAKKTELSNLASLLLNGENSVKGEKEVDPYPYQKLAESLEIKNSIKSLVSFEILSGKILVEGDLQRLLIISENILDLLANGGQEAHMHIEYFEAHPYLSEKSIPVVINCI
jgi:hypothetical protein